MLQTALPDFSQMNHFRRTLRIQAPDNNAGNTVVAPDHGFRINKGCGSDDAWGFIDFFPEGMIIFQGRVHTGCDLNMRFDP